MMPRLGWHHLSAYTCGAFVSIGVGVIKPTGGLWTSPLLYGPESVVVGTGWTQWCAMEAWGSAADATEVVEVVPDPDARVYVIDDLPTLARLIRTYPETGARIVPTSVRAPIDWPAVAADVDAVWLTERGQACTRFSDPSLYGWDCETVLWLNRAFTIGERIALAATEAAP